MRKFTSLIICLCLVLATLSASFSVSASGSTQKTAAKVSTVSTALNVRKTKSSSSKVLTTLKKGSWVTLISKSGKRWKVEYASGKYGYCHEKYITQRKSSYERYVSISSGKLNVRSGAGKSYKVKAKLKNGKSVVVLSTSGSYSKILYNGTKTGYVATKYLSETKPSSSTETIKLSVVSYKQNDSRWSSIKIGTQGDTISSSGCTTTCLAMTESVRTSQTVTPKTMASRLTYASAGWLYWPDNYNVQLVSSSDYLSLTYKLLKEGKPVIIGSKKANGSQHWVVVTGYSGNPSSLNAKDFTINDPGSSTRTKLSDFISVYPNLYKLVSYK